MPNTDNLLLLLCLGLTLLGILVTAVAARRGNRGRVVQGVALTLAPVGLYLSGLLGLLWNGVAAVGAWASALAMSRAVWLGLTVLAVCLVLWVVGGVLARRGPRSRRRAVAADSSPAPAAVPASGGRGQAGPSTASGGRPGKAAQQPAPVDDDMAEIEALLKSRGID